MRHGPRIWTENVLARRVREGFGQGWGPLYVPWLTVHDFASRGRQSRVPMRRYARAIHTHSYIERRLLMYLDFLGIYDDLLEQLPIPREVTRGAAKALKVRHPTYPITGVPAVMTYDLVGVINSMPDGTRKVQPYDCKLSTHLTKPRVQQLLSIHRVAAEHLGMERPIIFTEKSLPAAVSRNVEWIRGNLPHPGEPAAIQQLLLTEPTRMRVNILETKPDLLIADYCALYDEREGWHRGLALRVLSCLLWSHDFEAQLDDELIPLQPVPMLSWRSSQSTTS